MYMECWDREESGDTEEGMEAWNRHDGEGMGSGRRERVKRIVMYLGAGEEKRKEATETQDDVGSHCGKIMHGGLFRSAT
jgi:hypothetical protein